MCEDDRRMQETPEDRVRQVHGVQRYASSRMLGASHFFAPDPIDGRLWDPRTFFDAVEVVEYKRRFCVASSNGLHVTLPFSDDHLIIDKQKIDLLAAAGCRLEVPASLLVEFDYGELWVVRIPNYAATVFPTRIFRRETREGRPATDNPDVVYQIPCELFRRV